MRIVLVSDYFRPHFGGGVERVVEELAHNLVNFGHEVRVLTFNPDGWPAREKLDGVEIVRIPALNLQPVLGFPAALSASVGLHRYLEEADIIHVHNIFFVLSLLTVLSRPSAPIVTTIHVGSLANLPGFTGTIGRFYEGTLGAYVLRKSNAVTAVSSAVANHGASLCAELPIRVIPNTVDVDRFRPPAEPNGSENQTILFLGRFSRNKGPQYLVEAIPRVLSEVPEASFDFVGDGPLQHSLAKRMAELGLNGNARLRGKVPEVVPVLQRAGVVVRPSLTEGMPLAVMEAMACGRPVVASRVGGTADLIHHGETGVLFEPGNVAALTAGLIELLVDGQRAAVIGRRAREWAERRMTWERVSRGYEQLYEEVAS